MCAHDRLSDGARVPLLRSFERLKSGQLKLKIASACSLGIPQPLSRARVEYQTQGGEYMYLGLYDCW